MRVKEDRSIVMYILLSICTCGIYHYYFIYSMSLDANTLCEGDGKNTPGLASFILLSIITCGIYAIYWEYTLGNRLAENAPRYGVHFQENGSSVLMWYILGSLMCGIGPFIAIHILIKNMNALAHLYNNGAGGNANREPWTNGGNNSDSGEIYIDYLPEKEKDFYTKPEDWVPDKNTAWKPENESKEKKEKKPEPVKQSGLIECCNGVYKGAKFAFDGEIVIGRDGTCASIVIDNPKVSRKHCVIRCNPQNRGYLVMDTSSNGVFYKNGQAFPKNTPVVCSVGTILVIGKSGNEFILK